MIQKSRNLAYILVLVLATSTEYLKTTSQRKAGVVKLQVHQDFH